LQEKSSLILSGVETVSLVFFGAKVKERLGIPHIISLHADRDDLCRKTPWGLYRLLLEFDKKYTRYALNKADVIGARIYEYW